MQDIFQKLWKSVRMTGYFFKRKFLFFV